MHEMEGGKEVNNVTSKVTINQSKIAQLNNAAIAALEQTAEGLHNEVVQAQVMPLDTGTLQNESTFVDTSKSAQGKVSIVSSTAYARRLYCHPEYHFHQEAWEEEIKSGGDGKNVIIKKHENVNPNAQGEWFKPWIDGEQKDYVTQAFATNYKRELRK